MSVPAHLAHLEVVPRGTGLVHVRPQNLARLGQMELTPAQGGLANSYVTGTMAITAHATLRLDPASAGWRFGFIQFIRVLNL